MKATDQRLLFLAFSTVVANRKADIWFVVSGSLSQ